MSGPKRWTPLETEFLQDCAVFQVSRVHARSPRTGQVHPFFRIDASDWVNVVPLTLAGEVVMVRQYRHGSGEVTLEIPGGMVDPGEEPARAAARELAEETGFRAAEIVPLGVMNPNPALFGNRLHVFAAPGAERVAEARNQGTEETLVELVPQASMRGLVRDGRVGHALVVAALHLWELSRDAENDGRA